jgi:hypothetical protein
MILTGNECWTVYSIFLAYSLSFERVLSDELLISPFQASYHKYGNMHELRHEEANALPSPCYASFLIGVSCLVACCVVRLFAA